jgi:hypothetical protein
MKAGRLWPFFGQQVEAVDLALVEEDLAEIPDDALVDHRIAAAEPVEDFQRPLGEADRRASPRRPCRSRRARRPARPAGEVDRRASPIGPAPTITTG